MARHTPGLVVVVVERSGQMLGLFFQPSGSGKRGGEDDSVGLSGSLGWTCLLTCLSPPLPGHWPPNHVTHTPVRLYIYEFITKVMQRSVASIDHIYYKAYTKNGYR